MGEVDEPPSTNQLVDDPVDLFHCTNGQLKFADSADATSSSTEDDGRNNHQPNNSKMSPTPAQSNDVSPTRRNDHSVAFEIVSAEPVHTGKKKYISYTVLVKRMLGLETEPGVLERRYTDFLNLFQSLKRRFPYLMEEMSFPPKTLLGNFSVEVVHARSAGFQRLLTRMHAFRELRNSTELADFLYKRELHEAHHLLQLAQFEDASDLLRNVYYIQEKVLEPFHYDTYYTLCLLIASLNAVDNSAEAQHFAQRALEFVDRYANHELTLPFLVLCLRLWWAVGKDKQAIEEKINTLKRQRKGGAKIPTLLELVLHRECPLMSK